MTKRWCCPECFGDFYLCNEVFPHSMTNVGNCDYCATPDVPLLEPSDLVDYFEPLISFYKQDTGGKPLTEWLKEDWQLFDHLKMDAAHSKELLADILDDGEIVRRKFIPSPNYQSEPLMQWEALRREMVHQNRWFFDIDFDKERLFELLSYLLIKQDLQKKWFRARICADEVDYSIDEMGAPPGHLARHGRANPAGISYLYLGSTRDTAAAEVRPCMRDNICVAEFDISSISAVDLRTPRKSVSPLILQDPAKIGQLRADLPFLEDLGEELSCPVLPLRADIDYTPSQYLCEFIRKRKFEGVVYRSSVSDGSNLVIFDEKKATGRLVTPYTVKQVSVDIVSR